MNLNQIHSITKKICVALLGGFLLIFILFHACANLCILRNDDGAWYSAFCHFMGTNYIVKVVEIVLLLTIFLHICLTIWLAITNFRARGSVRYKHASKTKTHTGSKLMIWTGGLLIALLLVHFCDFYFVKLGWVEGQYMIKTEQITNRDFQEIKQVAEQNGITGTELIEKNEQQLDMYAAQMSAEQIAMIKQSLDDARVWATMVDGISQDGKWVKGISAEQKNALIDAAEANGEEIDVEPDFYAMARDKFKNIWVCLAYLFCFCVVWFHLRHAVPSVFQTLGWNNYTYNKAIDIFGICFATLVALMFAAVPIVVFFCL